ncbi:MAG: hypothetical protein ACTSRZ_00865 [Promethearchaeota archaeon]
MRKLRKNLDNEKWINIFKKKEVSFSNLILPPFYIFIAIFLSILYFILGFVAETGSIDINLIINGHVYSKYKYTLFESLLDVEQFLGLFLNTIMYSLLYAGAITFYGPTTKKIQNFPTYNSIKKKAYFFGFLALAIFISAIILSLLNIGLDRPEWDDLTFRLICNNFYDDFFARSIFPFILVGCFAFIPYLLANCRRIETIEWRPEPFKNILHPMKLKNINKLYLLIFIIIFEILLITEPLNVEFLFQADIIRELVYRAIDILLITGIIGTWENRQRKKIRILKESSINSPETLVATVATQKAKPKDQNATNIKKNKIKNKMEFSLYDKHTIYWIVAFICTLIFVAAMYLLIKGNIFSDLNIFKFISRIWVVAFQLSFVLCLYFSSLYFKKIKALEEIDVEHTK